MKYLVFTNVTISIILVVIIVTLLSRIEILSTDVDFLLQNTTQLHVKADNITNNQRLIFLGLDFILATSEELECYKGLTTIKTFENERGVVLFEGRQLVCANNWKFSDIEMLDGVSDLKEEFKNYMGPVPTSIPAHQGPVAKESGQ